MTSLIEEFHYPRLGPGQMWERLAAISEERGVDVRLNHRVTRVLHDESGVTAVEVHGPDGGSEVLAVDGIVSSIPLSELVLSLDPLPPDDVVDAARRLRYRDLLVVGLISTDPEPFPDNWIYLHDPGTRAGRVQNFGAWSPGMTRPGFTCLGVEYFCFQGDETWSLPDHALIELAKRELGKIGLIDPSHVVDGVAIRVPRAYPMYDKGYEDAVALLRDHIGSIDRLQTVGRNGLHRYNNQDHSMWTAVLGTLNLLDGADNDVWAVNADAEYLEETELRNPIDAAGRLRRGSSRREAAPRGRREQAGRHCCNGRQLVHRVQPDAGIGATGPEPLVEEREQVAIEGDLRREADGDESRATTDDAQATARAAKTLARSRAPRLSVAGSSRRETSRLTHGTPRRP